jgi:chromosome segregation protein
MFRFHELSLWNWDWWPPVRVRLDRDVVLLTGPNGSGKTTILDAVRQLLNAPKLSSKRRLQHYLRRPDQPALLRAYVSNDDPGGGGAPFRRERILTPEATLACALVPASGGTPEKRFALLPGRASVEEVRARLLDSREWIGPERWQRVLEQAGVTRSLMSVLALEQGKTNALFELSPRELLQRILDMLGDKAVLERYRDARRRYEDSSREVFRQTQGLAHQQAELGRIHREVERLGSWERLRDRVADIDARIPAAQLQEALQQRDSSAQKLPELRTKVRNGEAEALRLDSERTLAESALAEAVAKVTAARNAEHTASEAALAAAVVQGKCAAEVERLERDARELEALPARDLGDLESVAQEATRSAFAAERTESDARADVEAARERLVALEAGRAMHPPAVDATLCALSAHRIAATLLATSAEVSGEVARAAEAALGDARWALAVAPEHGDLAREVASTHAFPGPVWAGPVVGPAGDSAGPFRLAPGAPTWLREWAARTTLSPDGSWTDERGAWGARQVTPVLGERARTTALEEARTRANAAGGVAETARLALASARDARVRAEVEREEERRRRDIAARVAALPGVRLRLRELDAALGKARSASEAAKDALEAALAREHAVRGALAQATRELGELAKQNAGNGAALAESEAEIARLDETLRSLTPRVAPELRACAERRELDGVHTVERDLARAKADLDAFGAPPDPTVREEARHLDVTVKEAEQHVAARKAEADRADAELSACRQRYLEIVDAALQDYRRRAVDIARGAGVEVEIDLPRLTADDRALDDAALHASFGFDGKDPLPLGDPSFSGGQQVIAGLVLLMAMVEGEGRGFFILDEPFAHLSVDRIDDVGRFLRSAGAQFIITAPTTLDRAQLDPASLVVMLRKKKAGDPHAPMPVVAEA